LCGTSICVDERAETSYMKNISILHFHSLRCFNLHAITNENFSKFARLSDLLSSSLLLCLANTNSSVL